MPINSKIIKEIEKQEDEKLKKVMLTILEKEDSGTYKYKDVYEQIINNYIEEMEVE